MVDWDKYPSQAARPIIQRDKPAACAGHEQRHDAGLSGQRLNHRMVEPLHEIVILMLG